MCTVNGMNATEKNIRGEVEEALTKAKGGNFPPSQRSVRGNLLGDKFFSIWKKNLWPLFD